MTAKLRSCAISIMVINKDYARFDVVVAVVAVAVVIVGVAIDVDSGKNIFTTMLSKIMLKVLLTECR